MIHMSEKTFKKLEHRIEREYKMKGFPTARADYIGRSVAGEIARKRRRERV